MVVKKECQGTKPSSLELSERKHLTELWGMRSLLDVVGVQLQHTRESHSRKRNMIFNMIIFEMLREEGITL